MTLYHYTVGLLNITMLEYIYKILNDFDKSYPTGGGTTSIAAPYIIFKVDD